MSQLNNSFGSGGMSLALNEAQFSQFIQHLKKVNPSLPIRVCMLGKQEGCSVWVMGADLQVSEYGENIPEMERTIVWHSASIEESIGNVHLNEILPMIHTALDSSILTRYLLFNIVTITVVSW